MPPEILNYILPLFAVIAVIFTAWSFTKFLVRRQVRLSSGRNINVIERVATGKDSCLVLVKVGGRAFLISVSGQNSSLIAELDSETLLTDLRPAAGSDFLNTLSSALKNISKPGGEKGK